MNAYTNKNSISEGFFVDIYLKIQIFSTPHRVRAKASFISTETEIDRNMPFSFRPKLKQIPKIFTFGQYRNPNQNDF